MRLRLNVMTDLLPVWIPMLPLVKLNSLVCNLFFNLQQLDNESTVSDI